VTVASATAASNVEPNPGFVSGAAPTAATSKVRKAGSIIGTGSAGIAGGACEFP